MYERACGIGLALFLSVPAWGTLTVRLDDGSPAGPDEASVVFNPLTGRWDVTLKSLYNPGGETIYDIHGTGGEHIGNVYIDVPCFEDPNGDCLVAGSPVMIRILSDAPAGIGAIDNIVQSTEAETFLLLVESEGDIGSISVPVITTVRAGRDVVGPVIATLADHPTRGVFWVEAARDILGDVRADNGKIGRIWAHRDIGRPGTPATLKSRYGINGIMAAPPACLDAWYVDLPSMCGGAINAHITTNAGGGPGTVFRFMCSTFDGTIRTRRLAPDGATGTPGRMSFTTSLDGTLTMDEAFDHPDQWIEIGTGGLGGQVIFNALGHPGVDWSSPVYFGPRQNPDLVLNNPDYNAPPELIGSGAIALTPYGLQLDACVPGHLDSMTVVTGVTPTLRLRHYGPVSIAGSSPVIVERRPANGGFFSLVPQSALDVVVAKDDQKSILVSGAGIEAGYEYRVQATANLRMAIVSLNDPVAWSVSYRGTILAPACEGDLDGNGQVNLIDLLTILANWGAIGHVADIDQNGEVELGDLLIVLSRWGSC